MDADCDMKPADTSSAACLASAEAETGDQAISWREPEAGQIGGNTEGRRESQMVHHPLVEGELIESSIGSETTRERDVGSSRDACVIAARAQPSEGTLGGSAASPDDSGREMVSVAQGVSGSGERVVGQENWLTGCWGGGRPSPELPHAGGRPCSTTSSAQLRVQRVTRETR